MKVTAHLVVSKGYERAISASEWIGEVQTRCEEYNKEHHGDDYLSQPKEWAVVTVEFEVPDSIFERPPVPVIPATAVKDK